MHTNLSMSILLTWLGWCVSASYVCSSTLQSLIIYLDFFPPESASLSFHTATRNKTHSHWLLREMVKISILRGIRKLFGHKPGQLALGGPAGAGEVDLMTLRSHFPPQPFCDSPLKYTNSLFNSPFPLSLTEEEVQKPGETLHSSSLC